MGDGVQGVVEAPGLPLLSGREGAPGVAALIVHEVHGGGIVVEHHVDELFARLSLGHLHHVALQHVAGNLAVAEGDGLGAVGAAHAATRECGGAAEPGGVFLKHKDIETKGVGAQGGYDD